MSKYKGFKRSLAKLILEDGSEYLGWSFGKKRSIAGEVVVNTGMGGLIQTLTDPASHGQILISTYPMAGNGGIPVRRNGTPNFDDHGLPLSLESEKIQTCGLVISDLCEKASHYSAGTTLSGWLEKEAVTGIYGIDTRALAVRLRERGAMKGKILVEGKNDVTLDSCILSNPSNVSNNAVKTFGEGSIKVALIDCGAKANVIRCLLARNVKVIRVPFFHNLEGIDYDGIIVSGGPGDPKDCGKTIETIRKAFESSKPVFGTGLGNLIMALAAGADTYKMPFGHRGQNQPCIEKAEGQTEGQDTGRCYVTSQNHGFAVRSGTVPGGWQTWFTNANDGAIEGIRCENKPFSAVQFYPEGCPGPRDTEFLFDRFIEQIKLYRANKGE
ncbi:MAG: glutamine-hydrolyzing carbamoyl-phosphate synthase small subunit [Treponema sp.]|jgi:carbamoyl-phosphate synthase small subunit|nr:glutamine-hydrolyzing carbamoyl-phosphate synthase small subunit [Treponema sp.]